MRKTVGMLLMLLMLCACGNQTTGNQQEETPQLLEVDLTGPEHAEQNESVIFKAAVTYGDSPVEDADSVEFEVWKDGDKDNSNMIKPSQTNKGVYELHTTFKKDGIYIVQVHVTAKQQHNMPKTKINVGQVDDSSSSSKKETKSHH
ncbi:FixH family protein [Bacillus sp. NPDC077027]|uniref:FixH family protein n=1 Tax=Bacillus sp. NPDC077027 TaxID=3390548 RepID=UPI003CFFC8D8